VRRLVGVLVLGGCIEPRAFPCDGDAQCVLDGEQGECVTDIGYCSYPDAMCPSGLRFEALAVGHEGECVAVEGDSDGDAPNCAWQSVHVGGYFMCAIDESRQVYCWGANVSGELGIDDDAEFRPDPLPTSQPLAASALAADGHACAIAGGDLWCWGPNEAGQIDWMPTSEPKRAPVMLDPMVPVESVLVGGARTCVGSGASVRCWGANLPGSADPFFDLTLPAAPVQLASGPRHVCGRLMDESVRCIGVNDLGQLGVEGTPTGLVEVDVGGKPIALDVGDDHTCAIVEGPDGPDARSVVCWGDSRRYQAGSLLDAIVPTPMPIPGAAMFDHWVDIAAASGHSCALSEGGEIYCWGDNSWGRAHPNPEYWDGSSMKVAIDGHDEAIDISVGTSSTCAVWADHTLSCWGCLSPWTLLEPGGSDACPETTGTVRDFDCPAP
jgi:hypothetical protein